MGNLEKCVFLTMALIVVCSVSTLLADSDYGMNSENARKSLTGLSDVCPLLRLNNQAVIFGLDQKKLQTDIELKLRLAGIQIECPGGLGQRLLVADVDMGPKSKVMEAVVKNISLKLYQSVILERDSTLKTFAPTWEVSAIGYVEFGNYDYVANELKDIIDIFINAYLTENPIKVLKVSQ